VEAGGFDLCNTVQSYLSFLVYLVYKLEPCMG
jgi:hypothetical protein